MPPSMSAYAHQILNLTRHDLTDDVIETLYDIARRAQSLDGSSRALFTAYEDVLDEQGLQPSDDVVLHHFLFSMQKDKRRDESLITCFQRVLLDSFGIDVEIDEEGEGIEVTTDLDSARDRRQSTLGRCSRRGSFDSFFDGTAEKVAGSDNRRLPIRSKPRRWSGMQVDEIRNSRRTRSDTEAHPNWRSHPPHRPKQRAQVHKRLKSGPNQYGHKRSVSVSSRGSLQIRRNIYARSSRDTGNEFVGSEYTERSTSLDLSHIQVPGVNAPIPYETQDHVPQQHVPEQWQPSDTRLLDEAATFEDQRLRRVVRECMQKWTVSVQEKRAQRDSMAQLAIAFDRRTLLKASFGQWRNTLRMQHSFRETERFFTRLEARADKARNLFLLTKAFTHWAKSAEDEVQRTSVARRHILRTRYFNGWREITAVNELKVQSFVLGKFLRQWRTRAAAVRETNRFALFIYEGNLTHRIYKDWFFKFCAVAAPAWRNDRTRRLTLQKWAERAKLLRERETWATNQKKSTVIRRAFEAWNSRFKLVQSQQAQADRHRQSAQVVSALNVLQRQTQLRPLGRQLQPRIDGCLLRNTFSIWQKKYQLTRQARDVDRLRILRNAWTAWNDRLRVKALKDQIDDRLLVESLYKWALASRASLFERVHNRQLKQSTFLDWLSKAKQRAIAMRAAEESFTKFKYDQILKLSIETLEATVAERRAQEFAITSEYQRKLKMQVYDKLKERYRHIQQLNHWSEDARFYVSCKKTLKTWSEATQLARRNRRRDSYAQVRRTMKLNLVRRVLSGWRDKASTNAVQMQQATEMLQSRVVHSARALIYHWHNATITLQGQDVTATSICTSKLATRTIITWSSRLQAVRVLESQAMALRQEGVEVIATSALKKLGWRLWNAQRQAKNAQALQERNFEKHRKAMIRFWFEQTHERRTNRAASPTPMTRGRRETRDAELEDDQRQDAQGVIEESALDLLNDMDISFTTTPAPHPSMRPFSFFSNSSTTRPYTFPQTQPSFAPLPPTIPEQAEDDIDLGEPSTIWFGTPRFPPTSTKPGYLKTPSKRSIARSKRPDLQPNLQDRLQSPTRRQLDWETRNVGAGGDVGSLSAPPVQGARNVGVGRVTSFQGRLARGGFGGSVAGNGRGRGRVVFENLGERG